MKHIFYLIQCDWKMLQNVNNDVDLTVIAIKRRYLFFALMLCLIVLSITKETMVEKFSGLFSCLILLEMFRINNNCFLDPQDFIHSGKSFFKHHYTLYWIGFFSIGSLILSIFIFDLLVIYQFKMAVILFGLYLLFVGAMVLFRSIGNRILKISFLYNWMLFLLLGASLSLLNVFNNHHNTNIYKAMDLYIHRYSMELILGGLFLLPMVYLLSYRMGKSIWNKQPFTDLDSFPR